MEDIELALQSQIILSQVFISLGLTIIFGMALRSFYIRFSTSLSSPNHIANVLPVLSLVVFLVILIVKSSLALSLGLVGALSIVRFRTPIKEPEELIYLFLAIAVGLGFGANQALITSIIVLAILLLMLIVMQKKRSKSNFINISFAWQGSYDIQAGLDLLSSEAGQIKMLRYQATSEEGSMLTQVGGLDANEALRLVDVISKESPNVKVSVFEANTNW